MRNRKDPIESYILAKDGNRPHRLTDAFAHDASLAMTVKTQAITFPQESHGREVIASVPRDTETRRARHRSRPACRHAADATLADQLVAF
jgi:hypothetical protein